MFRSVRFVAALLFVLFLSSVAWGSHLQMFSLNYDVVDIYLPATDADGNFTIEVTNTPVDPWTTVYLEIERDFTTVVHSSMPYPYDTTTVSLSNQPNGTHPYDIYTTFVGYYYDIVWTMATVTIGEDGIENPPVQGTVSTVGTPAVGSGVTSRGDASAVIPIRTVPGLKGKDIGLSLVYDSGRGVDRLERSVPEDTIGYGWRLGGLSSIRRCVVDQASSASIALNNNDSLCLDGMPLVLESGNHLQPGAKYRTKIESFLKIEYMHDWALTGEKYFEVKTPDGSTRTYGAFSSTLDTQISGNPIEVEWFLVHEDDANDNRTLYQYFTDHSANVVYPVSISYHDAEVSFEYETRNDADTVNIGSLAQKTPVFLHTINVKMNDKMVREYRLLDEEIGGNKRLNKVQECGYSESGSSIQCLAPIEVDWTPPPGGAAIPGVEILVNKITDGLGAETVFEYKTLSSGTTGTFSEKPFGNDSLAPNTQNLSGSGALRHVVSKLRRDTGLDSPAYHDTTYAYQGKGVKSTKHWGFLGFYAQRIKDEQSGIVTYRQHRMDYPYFGRVAAVRQYNGVYSSSSTPKIGRVENQYTYKNVTRNGTTTKLPYSSRQTRFIYESNSLLGAVETVATQGVLSTGFIYNASTTRRTAEGVSISSASPSYWGDVKTHGLSSVIHTAKTNTTFTNRTSGADWLIGFVNNTSRTVYDGAIGGPGVTPISLDADYVPEADSNAIAEARLFPNSALESIASYNYDLLGNLASTTLEGASSSNDRTTTPSNYTEDRYPQTITNPLGHVTNLEYDLRYGTVDKITDPNGQVTTVTRDNFGRVTHSTDSNGVLTHILYEDCASSSVSCSTINGAAGKMRVRTDTPITPHSYTYYDKLGRETYSVTRDYAENGYYYGSRTWYDNQGRVIRRSLPRDTGNYQYVIYTYDQLGRVTQVNRPDGGSTAISRSVNGSTVKVTVTDTVNGATGSTTQETINTYNILGQLVSTTDAANTVTNFTYDAAGNTKEVSVGGATKTTFAYDAKGRRTSITGPNIGTQTTTYNEFNEVKTTTDAENQTTTFTYDKLGRVTQRVNADGTSTWVWDTATYGKGLLKSRTNNSGFTETYSYDSKSRLTNVSTQITAGSKGTQTFTTSQTYDGSGRPLVSTAPGGYAITRTYNSLGYPTGFKQGSSDLVTIDTMGAFGVTKKTFDNDVVTDYSYDPTSGRLTAIDTKKGGTVIQNLDYAWRSNGTLESRFAHADTGIGGSTRKEFMIYDTLNRLTQAETQLGSTVKRKLDTTYDNLGNITKHTSTLSGDDNVTSYGYGTDIDGTSTSNPGKHSVTSATVNGTGHTMTYDANGAITIIDIAGTSDDKYIKYNVFNQPTAIVFGQSLVDSNPVASDEYEYGPDGGRYYRKSTYTEGGVVKTEEAYIVGSYEKVYITGDSTVKEVQRTYVGDVLHLKKTASASPYSVTVSTEYLHRDHLGSITRITNASGSLISTQQFEPFGARKDSDWLSNTDATELSNLLAGQKTHTNRGFTGHEHLDRTGFIHMNGRLYEPTIARFMSPDPIVSAPGFSQSWNRGSYVFNSPLSFTDPSGYTPQAYYHWQTGEVYYCVASSDFDSYDFDEFPDGSCPPGEIAGTSLTFVGQEVISYGTPIDWLHDNDRSGNQEMWDPGPDGAFDDLASVAWAHDVGGFTDSDGIPNNDRDCGSRELNPKSSDPWALDSKVYSATTNCTFVQDCVAILSSGNSFDIVNAPQSKSGGSILKRLFGAARPLNFLKTQTIHTMCMKNNACKCSGCCQGDPPWPTPDQLLEGIDGATGEEVPPMYIPPLPPQ